MLFLSLIELAALVSQAVSMWNSCQGVMLVSLPNIAEKK